VPNVPARSRETADSRRGGRKGGREKGIVGAFKSGAIVRLGLVSQGRISHRKQPPIFCAQRSLLPRLSPARGLPYPRAPRNKPNRLFVRNSIPPRSDSSPRGSARGAELASEPSEKRVSIIPDNTRRVYWRIDESSRSRSGQFCLLPFGALDCHRLPEPSILDSRVACTHGRARGSLAIICMFARSGIASFQPKTSPSDRRTCPDTGRSIRRFEKPECSFAIQMPSPAAASRFLIASANRRNALTNAPEEKREKEERAALATGRRTRQWDV